MGEIEVSFQPRHRAREQPLRDWPLEVVVAADVGIRLFHCHVNDHTTASMMTRYRVAPR